MNKKLFSLFAVPVLGMLAPVGAFGQVFADMFTSTSTDASGNTVITQTGTISATGTDFRRFVFEQLDSVSNGDFAGQELIGVTVTITNELTGDFSVTVTNNDPTDDYIGPSGDFAQNNLNLPTFVFGANTTRDDLSGAITGAGFTAASPITFRDYEGVTIAADGGFETTSGINTATVTETSNVAEAVWGDYEGADEFFFDVRAAFGLETSLSGQNLAATNSTGDSTFTATVEYTVIPEPSTYAAIFGALAMGMMVVRRRFAKK
ncbi:MAG: PEP-CTERM sorting domain-containing protein [Opitutales bacterium]|nr:PEP-CTERM sorting domain-containing protein [Opitutales bacterium]